MSAPEKGYRKRTAAPRVLVLSTGGTIAGTADSPSKVVGYRAGVLGVEALLGSVPELRDIARITGEQLCNIDSKDMTDGILLRLARRVNEVFENDEAEAVVITHGTDTMEETAYFLSLTVNDGGPVVLTGAMRPATAENADGPGNLRDAVRVAACAEVSGKGVLVVMDGAIHAADEVVKTHTMDPDAFRSPENGPLGVVENGVPVFYDRGCPRPSPRPRFDLQNIGALPRVDILYGHGGDDGKLAEAALKAGARGIVYAGLGNGSIPAPAEEILRRASEQGVVIIRSTQSVGGPVISGEDAAGSDFTDSGRLSPRKARVLLRLALAGTARVEEIARFFRAY